MPRPNEESAAKMTGLQVVTELVLRQDPQGSYYVDGSATPAVWRRYLDVFGSVQIVARVKKAADAEMGRQKLDMPNLTVYEVPYYQGPFQFAAKRHRVIRSLRKAYDPTRAQILRMPGEISNIWASRLIRERKPYAVELVGDPYDFFAGGGLGDPLRRVWRWWFTRKTRQVCARALGVSYVTRDALQRRYPAGSGALSVHCSDVLLPGEAFRPARPLDRPIGSPPRLLLIGTLEQGYKGVDVLIDAVGELRTRGVRVEARIAGEGSQRHELESYAARRGVAEQVIFLGQQSRDRIFEELDACDVFVMPSRSEGLPRAMVEAMARGAPCIGTSVGGIPELLPEECLVSPNDPTALADRIRQVLVNASQLARMSEYNCRVAQEYSANILNTRREKFYQDVLAISAAHLLN